MCGLVGFWSPNRQLTSEDTLRSMTNALVHRGPDSEGYYRDERIGFGHRRLAIIDLTETANQPMRSKCGRYVLIYNGEVYNFRELRRELEALGHSFFSNSDSEVVLVSMIAWGPKAISRFNGMFAFAFWDSLEKQLFLGRDRYGIKPLYYTVCNDNLLFASESKAFLRHPSFKTMLDPEALLEYMTFQNFFTDKTLLKNVRTFPAGCFAHIGSGQSLDIKFTRYWDFCFEEPSILKSEEDYVEELLFHFSRAVERQLVSDVELGAYLSSGLDSGSIVAAATKKLARLKTFTIGFDLHSVSGLELAFDEREEAEHLSYLFKTDHFERVLKAGDLEHVMQKMAWHLEEPRVGQCYPNFYAAELASKFCKVILSGTGGDEIFGGYPWRYYRAVVNDHFEDYIDKYYLFWQRLIPNSLIKKVFAPIQSEVQDVWTRDIFKDVFVNPPIKLSRPEDYINQSLYFEAKTFLHGLLVVEDKLSMAHSVETRVPFLDNDLVDFAMKVPVNFKLGNLREVVKMNENEPGIKTKKYYEKTKDGKLILRKALSRYVPRKITNRSKQGFAAPDATWFRGESIDYVKKIVFENTSPLYAFLDRTSVQDLVLEHLEGKNNRRLLIWSLLNLDQWMKLYL